jgi:AcrR family transcriptional regulator
VTLRDRQAQQAKKLIIDAAMELFPEDGYVATTMDDIAESAGVARRTIYNQFGSKATLLIAAINDRVVGAGERSQVSDQDALREMDDPHQMIEAIIQVHVGIAERSLPLLKVTFEASAVDGEVTKEYERNEEYRYEAEQVFFNALNDKGFLRTDVPLSYLRRGFWLLAGPQMLITATNSGWDIATYARWVSDTVTGLLLGPDLQKATGR